MMIRWWFKNLNSNKKYRQKTKLDSGGNRNSKQVHIQLYHINDGTKLFLTPRLTWTPTEAKNKEFKYWIRFL